MRILHGFLLGLTLLFSAAQPTLADNITFTANPMFAEVDTTPGAQQTGVITITQDAAKAGEKASSALHLRVYIMDWTLDQEGNPQFTKPAQELDSCSSWITVNPLELTITPGSTKQVRYTINVPLTAQGTYHSMIMFESDGGTATVNGQHVALNGRIGSAIYVRVGPQVKRARISALTVTPKSTTLTIENTGTSHLRLKGMITYLDSNQRVIAKLPFTNSVVLPGKANLRSLHVDTPTIPTGVQITAQATIDYGGEVLLGARCHFSNP